MAKDNEKKGKRQFDLEKGAKRQFDLTKKPTRSFDLSKDSDEAADAPITPKPKVEAKASQPANDGGNGGGSRKTWLWAVLALIVVAILAWLFIPKGENQPTSSPNTETVNSDSASTAPEDSMQADSSSTSEEEEQPQATDETPSVEPLQGEAGEPSTAQPSAAPTVRMSAPAPQPAAAPTGSVEETALQVIRGTYGNNPERRNRLGTDYEAVQKRVNQLMRQQ